MRKKKPNLSGRLLFLLNWAAAFGALVAFWSVEIAPNPYWIAGYVSFTIPAFLGIHFAFLLLWGYRRSYRVLLPLAVLALGYPFIRASVALHYGKQPAADFTVLNYNVRVFNTYAMYGSTRERNAESVQWVANHEADIKCLQEYYSETKNSPLNANRIIGKEKGYQRYIYEAAVNRKGYQFGLAIFSRYPIVGKGEINFYDKRQMNSAMYADIQMPQGIIRVINVHLQSMSIDHNDLAVNKENVEDKSKNLLKILRRGFMARAQQVGVLEEAIAASPYPVIVCGDFNETPFSYAYHRFRKQLHNAFEEAGRGLDFTYHGHNKLFFLRIDHQFFDPNSLQAVSSHTLRYVKDSDHFPVSAGYRFVGK